MIASIPDFTAAPVAPKSGIANRELVGTANFSKALNGLEGGSDGSALAFGAQGEALGEGEAQALPQSHMSNMPHPAQIAPGNPLPGSGIGLPTGLPDAAMGEEADPSGPQGDVRQAIAPNAIARSPEAEPANTNALIGAQGTTSKGEAPGAVPKNGEPMRTVKLEQGFAGPLAPRDFKAPAENVLTGRGAQPGEDAKLKGAELTASQGNLAQRSNGELATQPQSQAQNQPQSQAQSQNHSGAQTKQPAHSPNAALDLLKAGHGTQAKAQAKTQATLATEQSLAGAAPVRNQALALDKRRSEADFAATQRLAPPAPASNAPTSNGPTTNRAPFSQAELEMPAHASTGHSASQAHSTAQPSSQAQAIAPPVQTQANASGLGTNGDANNAQRLSAQLENTIDQLTETRSIAQANRPEFTLRHQEFGAITMRIEAMGGDLRATLTNRDPGFVPAIQSALAERSVIASSDTSGTNTQRGQDQTGSQSHSQSQSQANSQNNPFAGSGGHTWHSEGRYGSSTGSGQGTSQPYSGQTDGADDETGSETLATGLSLGLGKIGEGERFA